MSTQGLTLEPKTAAVFDVANWLDQAQSSRRTPTEYVPKHRADGPAQ